MERAERFVLLGIGLAFDILVPVLWVMLVLTAFTAAHRFVQVYRQADRPQRPHARADRAGRATATGDHRGPRCARGGRRTRVDGDRPPAAHRVRAPQPPPVSRAATCAGGSPPARTAPRPRSPQTAARVGRRRRSAASAGAVARLSMPARNARMVARHQRRAATGVGTDAARPSTASFDSYGALLARAVPAARRRPRRRRSPRTSRSTGYEHIDAGLARGQRRDPRAAAPRRLGVRRRVAGARRATACSPSSSRSSRPSCFEWFAAQREALGLEVVPARSRRVGAPCSRALRANRIVCLLSRPRPRPATASRSSSSASARRCPAGPATLALRTGATLLPAAVYFRPGRDHLARRAAAAPGRTRGPAPRRRRPGHPGARATSSRTLIRARARAVAPAAAELAERPA